LEKTNNKFKFIKRRCKCGCGKITNPGRKYINGHNTRDRNKTMIFGKKYKVRSFRDNKLYYLWQNINQRCYYKIAVNYKYYGGRGIRVCIRWRRSFKAFYNWAINNGYKKGLDLDRIDNNGNYTPSNCRFISRKINCCNMRLRSDNKTGYIGITLPKNRNNFTKKYRAGIGGKYNKCIGYFEISKEAAIARNNYIINNNLPNKLNIIS